MSAIGKEQIKGRINQVQAVSKRNLLLTCILVFLLLLNPVTYAQDTSDAGTGSPPGEITAEGMTMDVRASFGPLVRQWCYFPVRITIENAGSSRRGQLRIISQDPLNPLSATFEAECDIPTNSRKTYFLYPYFLEHDPSPAIIVEYVERNNTIASATLEFDNLREEERLWIEVADEGSDFVFLSGMQMPYGTTFSEIATYAAEEQQNYGYGYGYNQEEQMILYPSASNAMAWTRPEFLPDRSEGYHAVEGLILNTRRFYELSQEQREALADWIVSGGSVIMWLGEDPNSYQGSFLTGAIDGSGWTGPSALTRQPIRTTLPALTSITGFTEQRSVLGTFPVTYATDPHVTTLLAEDGIPVLQHIRLGRGDILLSGLDLSSLKSTSPSGLTDYLRFMMGYLISRNDELDPLVKGEATSSMHYYQERTIGNPYVERSHFWVLHDFDNVLQSDNLTALPRPDLLVLFLLAYILIVGPVNYFILLKLRHREWLWYTIPLIVTVFVLISYTWALGTKGSRLMLSRANIIDAYPHQQAAWESSYFGIFSPAGRRYDIKLDSPYDLIRRLETPSPSMGYLGQPDQQYSGEVLNLVQFAEGGETRIDDAYIRIWSELHFESEGSVQPPGYVEAVDVSLVDSHLTGVLNFNIARELEHPFVFYYGRRGFSIDHLEGVTLEGSGSADFDIFLAVGSDLNTSLLPRDAGPARNTRIRNGILQAVNHRPFDNSPTDEIILAGWISGPGERAVTSPRIRASTEETLVLFHIPVSVTSGEIEFADSSGHLVVFQSTDTELDSSGNMYIEDGGLLYTMSFLPTSIDAGHPDSLQITFDAEVTAVRFDVYAFDHLNGTWNLIPAINNDKGQFLYRLGDVTRYLSPDGTTVFLKILGDQGSPGDVISIANITPYEP